MKFTRNKKRSFFFILVASLFIFIAARNAATYRVFTIGDSTVQTYNDGWAPRKGWGQVLQAFFNSSGVEVQNRAVGGTSSKSFYDSFWLGVKGELKAGDFVFIQFGINDRNSDPARNARGEVFKGYLRNFVNESRAIGAIPVLVSTVRRNAWNADGTAYDAYHEHPQLVREVAAELNVPLIDLDAKNKAGMEAATEPYTTRYWYNNYVAGEYPNYPNGNSDNVHFQEMGAVQLANYVVEEIQRLGSDQNLKKLLPYIKPQYPVTVLANHPEAGIVTRTETYPQGINLHIKALANSGHTFINWKDGSGNLITTNNLFQTTMPAGPLTYIAYFDDETINLDCAHVSNGTAYLDDCGICVGGTTGNEPCASGIQAENFCEAMGVSESTNGGFSGDGYLNFHNVLNADAVLTVISEKAGTFSMSVRYANGAAADRPITVNVNGNDQGTIEGKVTGAFTNWNIETIEINLQQGVNIFRLISLTENGGPNVDVMSFNENGITAGTCENDCQGVFGGNAFLDECEQCVGGSTGKTACTLDCNGEWGGSAYLDSCQRCIVEANGQLPCYLLLEAESECSFDGILEDINGGFSGSSYVNLANTVGSNYTFNVAAATSGTYEIYIRYANGSANNRPVKVLLNDIEVIPSQDFLSTSGWANWNIVKLNLELSAGINAITFESITEEGAANIDAVYAISNEIEESPCVITSEKASYNEEVSIYPNPFSNSFAISTPGNSPVSFKLMDIHGQILLVGICTGLCSFGEGIPSGMYLLELISNEERMVKKVVKK